MDQSYLPNMDDLRNIYQLSDGSHLVSMVSINVNVRCKIPSKHTMFLKSMISGLWRINM
jgi:hypothetical protein